MRPWLLLFAPTLASALLLAGCSAASDSRPRTYALGDRVQLGRLFYTVYETRWLTQIGDGPTARVPENRFLLVRMSVASIGAGEVLMPNLTIEDDMGTNYAELPNGEGVTQFLGMLQPVTAAKAISGDALFDAPPQHYRLHLWDEANQHAALVDIPLSFHSEDPDVPAPGAAAGPAPR